MTGELSGNGDGPSYEGVQGGTEMEVKKLLIPPSHVSINNGKVPSVDGCEDNISSVSSLLSVACANGASAVSEDNSAIEDDVTSVTVATAAKDKEADDLDGVGLGWPDDPDSGHPFTRAALSGDASTVREYASRQTFDPNGKKAQHALLVACRSGHVEIVKTLIEAGVDIHCRDSKSGWQPVHVATYRDHVKVVEALTMHGEWRKGVSLVRFRGITCSLLQLAANFGCLAVLRFLISHTVRLGLQIDVRDAAHWTALHHAACEGRTQAVALLLQAGADINMADPHGVTAIHAASYHDHTSIVKLLLSHGANPKLTVKLPNIGRHSPDMKGVATALPARFGRSRHKKNLSMDYHFQPTQELQLIKYETVTVGIPYRTSSLDNLMLKRNQWSPSLSTTPKLFPEAVRPEAVKPIPVLAPFRIDASEEKRGYDRVEPILKFHERSTLLHWAASKGYDELVGDLLARGLEVDARDRLGRTPLGLAVWNGHTSIVNTLRHEKVELSEEDKDWHRISREEVGLSILRVVEETAVCPLDACKTDGFSMLHLAAQNGYPNMMHRLLSSKVSPDVRNNNGETPLFVAIRSNQLACVQQLLNAGTRLSITDNRGGSALHVAAKNGNVTVVDMLLTTSEHEERDVDINRTDTIGYTPVYYAINSSRYDIVQRFLEYSILKKVHVKATMSETLLQFYTERNNLGQYDNAVVRVLECEKLLHDDKCSAEMCLRVQLGTTEASSKARCQLQAMYESTRAQRHCWNFWFFLSCFLVPSVFYYLDVYTDILLAVEYYRDYMRTFGNQTSMVNFNATTEEYNQLKEEYQRRFMAIFDDITDSPYKINFVLTVFFILLPITLLSMWNLYIHVTQMDILPIFRSLPRCLRIAAYTIIFLTPLAPLMAYLENTYAQMKHMNVTARQMLEVTDVTLGSILSLSPGDHETQLSKQVFSVLISLVSLTWSFTSYHRFSKLGGLSIMNSLPLLFGIFFQVVSRAIACTIFTLAFTWKIFVVLGVHFVIVLVFKLRLEERSFMMAKKYQWCTCFLMYLRPYFYVFLGTIASTLVYFRLERPSAVKKQLSRRQSTVVIQVLFLVLAFVENVILMATGIGGLDKTKYDYTFIVVSSVLCALSYLIGVILHGIYYGCYGHPWVNINGPTVTRETDDQTLMFEYYHQHKVSRWNVASCCNVTYSSEVHKDNIFRPEVAQNGAVKERQVKDLS